MKRLKTTALVSFFALIAELQRSRGDRGLVDWLTLLTRYQLLPADKLCESSSPYTFSSAAVWRLPSHMKQELCPKINEHSLVGSPIPHATKMRHQDLKCCWHFCWAVFCCLSSEMRWSLTSFTSFGSSCSAAFSWSRREHSCCFSSSCFAFIWKEWQKAFCWARHCSFNFAFHT